jgi:hypothetical protein
MTLAWHPLTADWQRMTYEALADLGPVWSAVAAGFAVILWGEVYLTPAGEAYLAEMEG